MIVSLCILAFVTQHANRFFSAAYYIANRDVPGSIKFFYIIS
jgi:hypothetical protein